jgi:hypothetical protein
VEVVVSARLERVVGLKGEELSPGDPISVVRMKVLVNLRLLSACNAAPSVQGYSLYRENVLVQRHPPTIPPL